MKLDTKFDIGDKVTIDGDASVVATVQRIFVSAHELGRVMQVLYEICWFDSNGSFKEHSMYEWQLEKSE